MKLALVVQRYGLEISGGAELHCRWVAERMAKYAQVEVLTTKAYDYITWKNHYPDDREVINGIPVRRFPVDKTRHPERFGRIQNFVLGHEHRETDELRWLEEEGPHTPALIAHIQEHRDDYDYFVYWSYRYYQSYWGIRTVPEKSILVPTAEHDPVVHLRIFRNLLRLPQAFIYNSVEERKMINSLSRNEAILGDVVGVGSEIPADISGQRFRSKYGVTGDYIIYIGRIDENKGCHKLFEYFLAFKRETGSPVKLFLAGSTVLKIPSDPDIVYLGFVSEQDKFDALDGALLLAMPSFYESLSMVALEAWALGKPVLANALCEVLKGQCLRSNAGLFYESGEEFSEALKLLLSSEKLRREMGGNGRRYFEQNYTWKVIEGKYLKILDQLENRKKEGG
jgi:glycosyltransferase involved in cell wall biosynthesis